MENHNNTKQNINPSVDTNDNLHMHRRYIYYWHMDSQNALDSSR
jgi:hypothetical protein